MKREDLLRILEMYRSRLVSEGVSPLDKEEYNRLRDNPMEMPRQRDILSYLLAMIGKMEGMLIEGTMSEGKGARWIGFMQGAFWCQGIYSVAEMRGHNGSKKKKG